MKKITKKIATKKVRLNKRMKERVQRINSQTYWYLMQLLDLEVDEAKIIFPRNTNILKEVFKAATAVLEKHGYRVCSPHMSTSETGRQCLCTPSECGCESCSCQAEFMEKERLFSSIENALALSGLKILDGDNDCIIVRSGSADKDFEIRISQLAG